MGHGGGFACGTAGNDGVCASCNLLFYDLLSLVVINLSICLKWCDQCNTGAFINCHVFSPPKYSKIVGNTQYASPDPPECSYRDVIWKNLVITSKEKEGLR